MAFADEIGVLGWYGQRLKWHLNEPNSLYAYVARSSLTFALCKMETFFTFSRNRRLNEIMHINFQETFVLFPKASQVSEWLSIIEVRSA